jgi:hypothetical protein
VREHAHLELYGVAKLVAGIWRTAISHLFASICVCIASMVRYRVNRLTVVGAAAVLAGCGGDLSAVIATAKTGESLAEHRAAMTVIDDNCHEMVVARRATRCPSTASAAWAVSALVDYSWALDRAASPEVVNVKDHAATALAGASTAGWTRLSPEAQDKVSALTGIVATMLTREMSRAAVTQAIRASGPTVDRLTELLLRHLIVETRYLQNELCLLRCQEGMPQTDGSCPGDVVCPPPNDSEVLLPLGALEVALEREEGDIRSAEDVVRAFRAAHQSLYLHVDDLSSTELIQAVKADLTTSIGNSR